MKPRSAGHLHVRAHTLPTDNSPNLRNRIAGGIAFGIGLMVVVMLIIDARWDNHDNIKPLKALFGGLAFVGLGSWYLIRGAKAEPWKGTEVQRDQNLPIETNQPDIGATFAELERQPSFQAEYQKVEAEMRGRAEEMEKTLESDLKG